MPNFKCPSCGSPFAVAAEHVGLAVRCPSCGAALGTAPPPGQASEPPTHYVIGRPPVAPAPGAVSPPPSQPGWPVGTFSPYAPPPPGYPYYMPPPAAPNPAGAWAFVLSLGYWVGLSIVIATLLSQFDLTSQDPAQIQEAVRSQPWVERASIGMLVLALVAFILGLYAVTRSGRRKGLAIAAMIIAGLPVLCGACGLVGSLVQ